MAINLPNIKATEIAVVQAELSQPQYIGLAIEEKAKLLSMRLLVESDETPKILAPISLAGLHSILSAERQNWLAALPPSELLVFRQLILANDRVALMELFSLGKEAVAVTSYLTTEIDDPKGKAKTLSVNRLTELLGREVGGISPEEVKQIEAGK